MCYIPASRWSVTVGSRSLCALCSVNLCIISLMLFLLHAWLIHFPSHPITLPPFTPLIFTPTLPPSHPHTLTPSPEFKSAGVDMGQPLVATCGSGVTAAHIALAAHILNSHIPVSISSHRARVKIVSILLCS